MRIMKECDLDLIFMMDSAAQNQYSGYSLLAWIVSCLGSGTNFGIPANLES